MEPHEIMKAISLMGKNIVGMPRQWLTNLSEGVILRTSDLKIVRTSDGKIVRIRS